MSQKNLPLSAIIIARNEEERLAACIAALRFCDEVIVVDNASGDRTGPLAKKSGARVVIESSRDFSVLHMSGATAARGEWLLYVDADEIVSGELSESILLAVHNRTHGSPQAYELFRVNYYLGRKFPGGEWIVRLMKKNALVAWEGSVHETARIRGQTGRLRGILSHYTHRSLHEMAAKTGHWSETEAQLRLAAGHPAVVPWRLIRVFLTGFLSSYITSGGWRVGTVGMIESIYQGFSLFITYARLWELQEKKSRT